MRQFRFLDWKVYQSARGLLMIVIGVVHCQPREYRYELGSQVIRSALSVVLNIAEGCGKKSDKEMNRFFDIALGSLYETVASLDTMKHLRLLKEQECEDIIEKADGIARQLGGFKKKLSKEV